MYIFKNALKNITRSKGRNILVGAVIVIISATSCIALAIRSSAGEIVSSYEDSFEITASLSVDREALRDLMMSQSEGSRGSMRDLMAEIESPGMAEIEKYGDSEYVDHYTCTLSIGMDSSGLEPLTNDDPENADQTESGAGQGMPGGGSGLPIERGDFTVIAYSSLQAMDRFISGDNTITSGSMFGENETQPVCVISDELAAYNDLTVGDTILMNKPGDEENSYTLAIAGIYKDTSVDDSAMNWFSNSANQIITAFPAVQEIAGTDAQISATFYLNNINDLQSLETEMKNKGLNEYYILTTNDSALEQTLRPLENLNDFAGIFLLIVLIIGGAILMILTMINTRERKYEIGVLRAIGMKKGKLAAQFVAELLIVSFISLLIGASVGALASVPTAQALLQNEIESIQNERSSIEENFGMAPGAGGGRFGGGQGGGREIMGGMFEPNANVDHISRINAVINFRVMLQLLLIGLGVTLCATMVSVVLISRYEPLRILSGRS